jgi:dTDP-4-dehydrorhamnose reductase
MARILITGISGLLGINLANETMRAHDIIGVDRGKLVNAPFKIWKADLMDTDTVASILDSVRPDWLINCAALASLEDCENSPYLAGILNTDLPAKMAKACKSRNVSFVHISTDAVFDGEKDGFYTEDDSPNPLGVYAKTKFDGERAVLDENKNAIVARVNFYGWSLSGKRSLAEFFHHNLNINFNQNAGEKFKGFVSSGWHTSHEQVSIWSRDRAQVQLEGRRNFPEVHPCIQPDRPPCPQPGAFHPQVIHRSGRISP